MGISFDSLPPHVKRLIAAGGPESPKPCPDSAKAASGHSRTILERELHRDVANWLLRERIWFVDSRMDRATTQRKGVPDFVCCVDGLFLAIELKRPGEKLSEDQQREFDDIGIARGVACVVTKLEEVIRAIFEIRKLGSLKQTRKLPEALE